nr:MAG TPA: hypothetical protein [Caudoviricetes sp.]
MAALASCSVRVGDLGYSIRLDTRNFHSFRRKNGGISSGIPPNSTEFGGKWRNETEYCYFL